MAIFHCSIKIISRSGGRTAVASAAYRAGESLTNEENGLTYDFTHKGGVVHSEIMLPDNAPEKYRDRSTLWNEVQQIEKRSDAQMAREVEVALPVEFSRERQIEVVRQYVQDNFVSKGMVADWALHDKGDGNPHAHIMLTVRGFDDKGQWQKKQKTMFARDENGEKIPLIDPATGKQKVRVRQGKGEEKLWMRVSVPSNDWNDHSKAEEWRKAWAEMCNQYLALDKQIDHRSYARQAEEQRAQGLDVVEKVPTIHEGVTARKMAAEGKTADRVQINRDVRQLNAIQQKMKDLAQQITAIVTEKARGILERFKRFAGRDGHTVEAGRDAEHTGRSAERDRSEESDDLVLERTAGRSATAERDAERTEQQIAAAEQQITGTDQSIAETDRMLEVIRQQISEKRKAINERLQRLQHRQPPAGAAVEGERPGRGSGAGYRGTEPEPGRDDTAALLREVKATIRDASAAEKSSGTERADREAEQQRQAAERSRDEAARVKAERAKRIRRARESRDFGIER